ncbi:MAG: cation-translocating P-type ATPase [Planctomycetota bacterium]
MTAIAAPSLPERPAPTVEVDEPTGGIGARLFLTLAGGVLLLVAAGASWFLPGVGDDAVSWHAAVVAAIAAMLLGLPIVADAFKGLRDGRVQVNSLAALAIAAAFVDNLYQTAGWIAFFMSLSTLIESRTALGARRTIERLLRLTPSKALKIDGENETIVEAKDLRPGDVVRVRPGDNLPGDGVIVKGGSSVDQANITGESLPVDVDEGSDVYGGTTNLTGLIDVRITKAGSDTTLGRVQELVLEAEGSKTQAQRLADLYASYHTPTMLMLAAVVWFFTLDIERFIALLVVATPAGIILATPTAMVAALSAAARLGILVKNVTVLEEARNLSAVVLDKTGTLTTGRLSVSRLAPVEGVEPAQLLSAAVSLEQNSTHPVARAVVAVAEKARVKPEPVDNFEEKGGLGVVGTVAGEEIRVGREAFLKDANIAFDLPEDKRPPDHVSVLYVARAGRLLGWIGLEDKVRDDSAAAVELLKEQGVRQVVMVTGDRWGVARRVATETKCTDVQAEVLPADKLKVVEGLKQKGHVVAVVGDGVNDAPALAAGDLSVAMGAAGSDVAISSASVALMNNRLDRIPFLQRLARSSGRVIIQGIGISLGFIIIFGTLAAAGLINPILAAALHALSSVVVVFNSARLVRQGEELDATPIDDDTFEDRLRETITPQPVVTS